jgi:hypothetical protein
MCAFKVSRRSMQVSAVAVAVTLVVPTAAKALSWDIFSVIDSTISKDIGGALQSMSSIQNSMRQDEQQLLFPLALINQSHNYIHTIMTSYRSWMTGVFTLPINSAQLPSSQALEEVFLSGTSSSIGNLGSVYNASFGGVPPAAAAPLAHRQMMDMDDALAKDSLAQSVAADQVSGNLLQIANQIESEASTTAPGTADILSATARAAELEGLASQHKLLAAMLREEAANLAHHNGVLKQSVGQAQQLNTNLQGTLGQ